MNDLQGEQPTSGREGPVEPPLQRAPSSEAERGASRAAAPIAPLGADHRAQLARGVEHVAGLLGLPAQLLLERLECLLKTGVAELAEVSAGQILWRNGEAARESVVCLAGLLKLVSPGEAGRVYRLVLPGELGGASYLLPGGRHLGTLVAATDGLVLRSTKESLRRWLADGPDSAMIALQHQSLMIDLIQRQLCFLTEGSVSARLARLLLLLAGRAPRFEEEGLLLNLTQAELASLIGARRETVARQLSVWRKQAVITFERSGPWRLNTAALMAEAEGPELDWTAMGARREAPGVG